MLAEFCRVTGAEESTFYQKYESTIFKYASLEQKKAVKKLLSQCHTGHCDNAGTLVHDFSFIEKVLKQ